jgi:hypothetical protein
MTGHLLHIGYPKTGSTFLQRWFAAHPQLAFSDGGIAGFRDVYAIARDSVTPRASELLFRVTSCEGLTAPHANAGDAVVEYGTDRRLDMLSSQAAVCTTVAELFPNALVLIVTRGFRAMILSSYSQYVRSGGDVDLADLIARNTNLSQLDPWNYDALIDLYTRAFGDENVIVMPYELLRDDADAFTRALEARLGLAHLEMKAERANASLSAVEMYWYPRFTRAVRALPIGSGLRRLYDRGAFANRFRRPIHILQRVRPGRPVTADAIPDEIVNAYRGKAERLRTNPLYVPYAADYLHE